MRAATPGVAVNVEGELPELPWLVLLLPLEEGLPREVRGVAVCGGGAASAVSRCTSRGAPCVCS